jgi:hypothetical protein
MQTFTRPTNLDAFAIEATQPYTLLCTNVLEPEDYLLGVTYSDDKYVVIRHGTHEDDGTFSLFQMLMTEGSRDRLGVQESTTFMVIVLFALEKNGVCLGATHSGEFLYILPQVPSKRLNAIHERHAASLFTTRANKTLGSVRFGTYGYLAKSALLKALNVWLKAHASGIAHIYETTGPSGRTEKKYRFIPKKKMPARSAMQMLNHVEKHIGRSFKHDMENNANAYPEIAAFGDSAFEKVTARD